MSSSCGEPSKKMGWYKSMLAKAKYDDHLLELAKKGVGLTSLNLSKKYQKRYVQLQELAVEIKKREEQREAQRKKEQQKKEKANDNEN